jgi:DNA-binding transcriptional MerR regulator
MNGPSGFSMIPFSDMDDPADRSEANRAKLKKAAGAFRTISEVADELHIPQHVLRFWETKFPQVKPLKRGGGRRYYRPDDITLLRRISDLLYIQGYTIKGVQRLLREGGGKLSDDIPPATPDERAEAQEEHEPPVADDELQLPMPSVNPPSSSGAASPAPAPPAREVGPHSAGEREAERLRTVLVHTLRELEALRALIH